MIFICLIVYVATIYVGYKFYKEEDDRERELTAKEKVFVAIWISLFFSSQMFGIHEIFKFLGIGVE